MDSVAFSIGTLVFASTGFWGLLQLIFTRHWDKKDKYKAEIERLDNKIDSEISKTHEEANLKIDILKNGVFALLRDRLFHTCKAHINDGFITLEDFDELTDLHDSYNALGGNHTGDELYEKCKNLPMK